MEFRPDRRTTLGLRWLVNYSRHDGEDTMEVRLAKEIMDAANNTGASVKKREDTHKMAGSEQSVCSLSLRIKRFFNLFLVSLIVRNIERGVERRWQKKRILS